MSAFNVEDAYTAKAATTTMATGLILNDRQCFTLNTWGDYLIEVIPMYFNDRLVMTPEASPQTYDHAWCYEKNGGAFLAALMWDPNTHDEPPGWKKRVNAKPRLAPERDPSTPVRCQHGQYGNCLFIGCTGT